MKRFAPLFALFLFTAACDDGTYTPEINQLTLNRIKLRAFSSCDEFEKARTYFVPPRSGSEPLRSGTQTESADNNNATGMAGETGETNVQVAGVDEIDTSKADGHFIYHIMENAVEPLLLVLRRNPGDQAAVVQEIELEARPFGIFLTEGQLIFVGQESVEMPVSLPNALSLAPEEMRPRQAAIVQFFDRAPDGRLTLKDERSISGDVTHARLIDRKLHLVMRVHLGYRYATSNAEPIEEGLPITVLKSSDRADRLANCTSILHEPVAAEPERIGHTVVDGLIGVVSIDIEAPATYPSGVYIAGNSASHVYASKKNLVLASGGWWGKNTPIHQFALAEKKQPTAYIGSALIPGTLLNQFSMDEHKDHLRVATTSSVRDEDVIGVALLPNTPVSSSPTNSTVNQVLVLKLTDGDLELAGSIVGLAPTERIYATRFLGDRGFVVTFKKVDPLFALDLSDPRNPRVAGELKIPGYSNYLHPMEEGYLLAIGKDADVAEQSDDFAWFQGVAMSIFDVRDLDHPTLLHKISIGNRGTESEALQDHKAYRYIPETNQVVIPISVFEGGNGQSDFGKHVFTGFQIYRASIAEGFHLEGQSEFTRLSQATFSPWSRWAEGRSFYRDGLISMLGAGELVIRTAAQPGEDVARISLPGFVEPVPPRRYD